MKKIWIFVLFACFLTECNTPKQLSSQNLTAVFPPAATLFNRRRVAGVPAMNSVVSVVAVGDVMLGARVLSFLEEYGPDYPFEATRKILIEGDFSFANLEAPFTYDGEEFEKKFNFKVPPEYASGLARAGIDVVSLANNHILDYGETGFFNTLSVLDEIGVRYCGAGRNIEEARAPVILKKNNLRVAFLAYSMTFPVEFWADEERAGTCYPFKDLMIEALHQCEQMADFVVVSFHWGSELLQYPKPYQIEFAHLAIDEGADLVIGHHPHVLQGMELYKNRLIAYSLGNFVFGSYSPNARQSVILKVYLAPDGLLYAKLYPISVFNEEVLFQPKPLKNEAQELVLKELGQFSSLLNNGQNIITENGFIWGRWAQKSDSLSNND